MLDTLQNFYKATITTPWATGTGNRYVDVLPSPSSGILVVNPSSASRREIVEYSAKGTDGGGNYITISTRGVGGTTDQTHAVNESVRMNITAEHYADIQTELNLKTPTSYLDTDVTLAANSDVKIATQKATKTYADTKVSLTGNETVAGIKTFSSSPIVPTPTTGTQAANKDYADGLAIAGSPNASTTVKGIVEEATPAEVSAGTDTGGTGARLFVIPSLLPAVQETTLVSGENLSTGDAVIIANGTESALLLAQSTTNTVRETQTLIYQSFTTGATTNNIQKIIMLWDTNGGSMTADLTLRTSAAGADMFTPVSTGVGNQNGEYEFVIPGGVTVSPNTTYFIVCNGTFRGGTTSSYSGGVSGYWNGSSWVSPAPIVTGDFYFKVFEGYTVAGRVYKTSADNAIYSGSSWTASFIGFVKAGVLAAADVTIQVGNVFKNITGLAAGAVYYLSNTQGVVSATAGTVSKKVGIGISSTSILIKHDN